MGLKPAVCLDSGKNDHHVTSQLETLGIHESCKNSASQPRGPTFLDGFVVGLSRLEAHILVESFLI